MPSQVHILPPSYTIKGTISFTETLVQFYFYALQHKLPCNFKGGLPPEPLAIAPLSVGPMYQASMHIQI